MPQSQYYKTKVRNRIYSIMNQLYAVFSYLGLHLKDMTKKAIK